VHLQKVLEVMSTSVLQALLLCMERGSIFIGLHCALFQARLSFSCANLPNDMDGLGSIESEMSRNFSSLNLDGLPFRSASNTEPVSRNFS
jgi:hypothetical protein